MNSTPLLRQRAFESPQVRIILTKRFYEDFELVRGAN